jgi:hypothetical protein
MADDSLATRHYLFYERFAIADVRTRGAGPEASHLRLA